MVEALTKQKTINEIVKEAKKLDKQNCKYYLQG